MRIIGIDPGSKATGYGIVDVEGNRLRHVDNGIVSPPASKSLPDKLGFIYAGIEEILAAYQPQTMAVEQIFVAKNPRSSLILGHARGGAILAGVNAGLAVHEYTAMQVKSAVVGYGRAGKQQVQQMVKALLNLPEIAQEDASDALAVAICHANSRTINQAIVRNGR